MVVYDPIEEPRQPPQPQYAEPPQPKKTVSWNAPQAKGPITQYPQPFNPNRTPLTTTVEGANGPTYVQRPRVKVTRPAGVPAPVTAFALVTGAVAAGVLFAHTLSGVSQQVTWQLPTELNPESMPLGEKVTTLNSLLGQSATHAQEVLGEPLAKGPAISTSNGLIEIPLLYQASAEQGQYVVLYVTQKVSGDKDLHVVTGMSDLFTLQ